MGESSFRIFVLIDLGSPCPETSKEIASRWSSFNREQASLEKGFGVTKIIVDVKKCRGTGTCVLACPRNAISILDGVAAVDETKCDLDGICIPACPHQAIHFTDEEHS